MSTRPPSAAGTASAAAGAAARSTTSPHRCTATTARGEDFLRLRAELRRLFGLEAGVMTEPRRLARLRLRADRHPGRDDDPRVARQPRRRPARRRFVRTAGACSVGRAGARRAAVRSLAWPRIARGRGARRPGLRCSRCSSFRSGCRLRSSGSWRAWPARRSLLLIGLPCRAGAAGAWRGRSGDCSCRSIATRRDRAVAARWILAAVLVAAMPGACRAVQRRRRGRLPRSTAWRRALAPSSAPGTTRMSSSRSSGKLARPGSARRAEQLDEALKASR